MLRTRRVFARCVVGPAIELGVGEAVTRRFGKLVDLGSLDETFTE